MGSPFNHISNLYKSICVSYAMNMEEASSIFLVALVAIFKSPFMTFLHKCFRPNQRSSIKLEKLRNSLLLLHPSISISLNSRLLSLTITSFSNKLKISNSSIKNLSQSFLEWKEMELRRNLKRKALADCTNTIPTSIPRKPFSDHTNIPTSVPPSKKPFSSSLTKPTKPPKSSLSIRNSDENSFTSCESNHEENPSFRIPQPSSAPTITTTSDSGNSESEAAENPRIRTSDSGNCESDDAENPRIHPQPSTPPRRTTITAANSDDFNCEDSGVGTIYTRRNTVDKTRDKGKAVMVSSSCPRIRTSDSGNCESDNAENPIIHPQPSTPPRPTTITAANSDDFNCEDSGVGTVYTRRKTVEKTRDKGKAVMVSSSCPPAERTRRNEDQLDKENRDVNLPKSYSSTVACPKAKKQQRKSLPLPQDFINKQKAYFAEIDAFELPEEVVSESELE